MVSSLGLPADGFPDQGWKLYLTSLIMVIFAGIFVAARFIARIGSEFSIGSDDYTILASLAMSVVLSVTIQLAVVHGYGMHKVDLTHHQYGLALEWFFVAQSPYKAVICLNKVAVILFYKRLFVTKSFQWACWACIALVSSWSVGAVFATILQCIPIAASFNNTVKAVCIDKDKFWIAYAVGNVLTDALVLLLPLREVIRLHLNLRDKLLLYGVFLLGGFVTVCSILRATAVSSSLENIKDLTYNFIPRGIWTLVEANLGIICSCLPILKQPACDVFRRMRGKEPKMPLSFRGRSVPHHTHPLREFPSHERGFSRPEMRPVTVVSASHNGHGTWEQSLEEILAERNCPPDAISKSTRIVIHRDSESV